MVKRSSPKLEKNVQVVHPLPLEIQCPICSTIVKQISSATLNLALWQHQNWVCQNGKAGPSW